MADPTRIMDSGKAGQDMRKALGVVDRNRPLLDRAQTRCFRQVDGRDLNAHVFLPPDWSPRDMRPVMMFFHGSLWDKGLVSQFAPQALYFAERGLITILFEYRLPGADRVDAMDSLDDICEAHRWISGHAGIFGADPGRIIMAGASAGAWMAMVRTLDLVAKKAADRDQAPPAALIAFEPICEVSFKHPWGIRFADQKILKRLVPRKMISKGVPPALFFHGSIDPVVPIDPTAKLAKAWRSKNPQSEFVPYEGAGHGFYNFNVDMRLYENTLNATDAFLVRLGFLAPGEGLVAL